MPNPLGITGIVFFRDDTDFYVFIRWRKEGISETNVFDFSFSGLIDYFDFYGDRGDLFEVVKNEIVDEMFVNLDRSMIKNFHILGLVANPKYLYQPELIISIELDRLHIDNIKNFVEKIDLSSDEVPKKVLTKNNIVYIVKFDDIKYIFRKKLKVKNLFLIAYQLFEKKIFNHIISP